MNDKLKRCLDDLETRIDPAVEEQILWEWKRFSENRSEEAIFSPKRQKTSRPTVEWPKVPINAALADYDQMALQQYGGCSSVLASGIGAETLPTALNMSRNSGCSSVMASGIGMVLNVRCNYGSSIAPLLFGVKAFVMDDEFDTLPTSEPLNDKDAIKRLIDAGVPDLKTGYGAQVLEMGRRYAAIARAYPKIGKYVYIYHPDLQGPLDICEVVWGSTMFYSLYDEPELVKGLLDLAVETYTAFMKEWLKIVPFHAEGNAHWGLYHKGNIMVRDDSAMNLSSEMFEEFVKPYDQELLKRFGGGAIHFCGKGDHYISRMTQIAGVNAINLSQPEYNNMETIYQNTVDKGIKLIGLRRDAAEAALKAGRDLRGQVHCW
jgi:hypothetical protein